MRWTNGVARCQWNGALWFRCLHCYTCALQVRKNQEVLHSLGPWHVTSLYFPLPSLIQDLRVRKVQINCEHEEKFELPKFMYLQRKIKTNHEKNNNNIPTKCRHLDSMSSSTTILNANLKVLSDRTTSSLVGNFNIWKVARVRQVNCTPTEILVDNLLDHGYYMVDCILILT